MIERGFAIRAPGASGIVNDYEIAIRSSTFETIGRALKQKDIDMLCRVCLGRRIKDAY